ncbi:hypothetical protein Salat_2736700 [Sesamum alatum]|uniref:Uncharacterized protein n=1 Tax=Sesamum alatum TaxID=300844 RepID=A0AAE2C8U2_9LAMI|nr:hypothetical protein Salat_2736700 [Sesamum alatum]
MSASYLTSSKLRLSLMRSCSLCGGGGGTPDPYESPLDRFTRLQIMMNRASVRKFIPKDVLAMLSSFGTRSGSSIPSDLILPSLAGFVTPPPPPPPSFAEEAPMIDVVTSPEEGTSFQTPFGIGPTSSIPPPIEAMSSMNKKASYG